jgi:hypothetical protein
MTLMVEATRVIELRLRLMALGRSTLDEISLMVTEKIDALEQAKSVIVRGGDPSLIIDNYRKLVAANVARLSSSGGLGSVGREACPVVIIPSSVSRTWNRLDPDGMSNLHKHLCSGAVISTPIITPIQEIEDEQGYGHGKHDLHEPIVGVLN